MDSNIDDSLPPPGSSEMIGISDVEFNLLFNDICRVMRGVENELIATSVFSQRHFVANYLTNLNWLATYIEDFGCF